MNKQPNWLEDAPDWFQNFYTNDFTHFANDCNWMKRLIFIILAAVIGGYFIGQI